MGGGDTNTKANPARKKNANPGFHRVRANVSALLPTSMKQVIGVKYDLVTETRCDFEIFNDNVFRLSSDEWDHKKENRLLHHTEWLKSLPAIMGGKAGLSTVMCVCMYIYIYIYIPF